MKKFNVNCILFVFAAVFVLAGFSGRFCVNLLSGTGRLFSAVSRFDAAEVEKAEAAVDKVTTEDLGYHDLLMDIDSLRNNLLGTRVVVKDDTTVIKSDSGSLCERTRRLEDSEIEEVTAAVKDLQEVSEEYGAKFLYCAAPRKEIYEQFPANVNNLLGDNFGRFLSALEAADIPALSFQDVMQDNGLDPKDIYYYTDHHWKAYPGFLAASEICQELSSRYGFIYNEQYADINNYDRKLYPDWFLGSKGKKVGTWFTWHGADDFELITPAFETDMKEEQPVKNEVREGTFEETVLFMKNLEKDYYHKNPYVVCSGGDFRLQIMTNNLNKDGKKILLIRDSFASAVAPYLALQTAELHICDIRDYSYFVGDRLDLEQYIQDIRPDYVLVLYSGVGSVKGSHGKFDFLKQ